MNNAIIHEVIAINNRCIENLHDGNIAHMLSELQVAMYIIKQRVAAIDPICCETNVAELQTEPSSPGELPLPSPQLNNSYNTLPSNHHHQLQQVSSTVVARIKFSPMVTCLLSQSSPKPISICQHQLLLVAEDKMYETSSMENHQENGAVSTEDMHLICATLLYNMGLLCHKYAYIYSNCSHYTTPNTSNIVRASKIYELLIEFCNQGNIVTTGTSHPPNQTLRLSSNVRMIQMIAYNNYAEICYEVGNYVMYKHSMNEIQNHLLLELLTFYSNNSNSNNTAGSGADIVYRELQLNVLIYKLCPAPTLASAA